jgi:hypothetical protein
MQRVFDIRIRIEFTLLIIYPNNTTSAAKSSATTDYIIISASDATPWHSPML